MAPDDEKSNETADVLQSLAAKGDNRADALNALAAAKEKQPEEVPVEEIPEQSADALKSLAAGEEKPSADALAALASGQDVAGAEQAEAQEDDDVIETEGVLVAGDTVEGQSPAPRDPTAVADELAFRKAQAARFHRQSMQAHHEQMKRFMIPLLLAVGIMLFVFGAILAAMMPGAGAGKAGSLSMLTKPWAKAVVFASFPVGAILLLGAWLFHKDVSRSVKR
jgi:hypothetical protein